MFHIAARVLPLLMAGAIAYIIVTAFWGETQEISAFVVVGLGLLMALIGLLQSIRRNSPLTLGAISRTEVYGVIGAVVGYLVYTNTRIDQIMLKLME